MPKDLADWFVVIEAIAGILTFAFAIFQFSNMRKLKKIERRLLLHSRFYYLESLLSASVDRIMGIAERGTQIPELNLHELAKAYRLNNSVLDVVSEVSELSYGCFDRIDRESAKNIQDFLGCVSETYRMLNGFYGALENGTITSLDAHKADINKMYDNMKNSFNNFRIEMYKHCAVKHQILR